MLFNFHGHDRPQFANICDQMFRLRAQTFADRLGWNVSVRDGWEIDAFDDMDPLYICSVDHGQLLGCMRLLPTTGPTLLAGPLAYLFSERVDITHPTILEGTRIAVSGASRRVTKGGVNHATVELMMGACSLMLESGFTAMVGVVQRATYRLCDRVGWSPEIIARSIMTPDIYAVIWDVTREALEGMRRKHDIALDCLDPPESLKLAG